MRIRIVQSSRLSYLQMHKHKLCRKRDKAGVSVFFRKKETKKPIAGTLDSFKMTAQGRASIHPDGITFFHLRTGVIFTANRIGAHIWQGLVEQHELAKVIARISHEYSVPQERVADDALAFIGELKAHEFLTEVGR